MAELFHRCEQWLAASRRVLRRSDTHDDVCRTACIVCILSSVSQEDARDGMLDRRAALRVLDGTGNRRECVPETVPQAVGPAQGDMLEALRRRREAAAAR
jgi:hypothetical protein